jgi:hypothetical protein
VVGKGIDEALQLEEKTGEVRRDPKRGGRRRRGGAHRRRGRRGGEAQITALRGGDSATDTVERSREGEGHLRRAPKREWGWMGKKGAAASGCAHF